MTFLGKQHFAFDKGTEGVGSSLIINFDQILDVRLLYLLITVFHNNNYGHFVLTFILIIVVSTYGKS